MIEPWATRVRLRRPRERARVRRRRWLHSQRKPSPISVRRLDVEAAASRTGVKAPRRAAVRAEAAARPAAPRRKGRAEAAAKRAPPSGGPANWLVAVAVPARRALALGSAAGETMAGRTPAAAVSKRVSPEAIRKKTA